MRDSRPLEAWQRGPIPGVPPLLQPVAHAIVQAREDARTYAGDLDPSLLWTRPAGLASPGFHIRHIAGVIDRLFTYARDEVLDDAQRETLRRESLADDASPADLLDALDRQVDRALVQLRKTDEASLLDFRGIGRAQLPSNVIGLLFHAAEHAQRHVGQLLVTVRVVREERGRSG